MNRAFSITATIVAVTLGCAWGLNACAREPAAAQAAANPLSKWTPGLNYAQLPSPQPVEAQPGHIVVNEVFWYGCGHCYALDPTLEKWKQSKPAYVDFVRIPVMWAGVPQQQHAKLYYTLMQLNRLDLHTKVFDTIHKEHNLLAAPQEADARAMQLAFCKANGISEADFNAAYDSPAVADFSQVIGPELHDRNLPVAIRALATWLGRPPRLADLTSETLVAASPAVT